MADYTAHIANCLIGGEHFTKIGSRRVRNRIDLHLDGFSIAILQNPEVIMRNYSDFVGHTVHATDLIIPDLPAAEFQRAQDLARDVAEILSFVTCSPATDFGYSYADGDPPAASRTIVGQVQFFRPMFDTRRGEMIRSLLEQTWPTYRQLRGPRQLNIAIDYHVLSHMSGHPVEVQLILTFVLLENLKHTFAQQQGYPYIRGYFRNHGATATHPDGRKIFQTLLTEMFAAVGMAADVTPFVSLRNDLIHSGISHLDAHAKWEMFGTCQDLLREYFLRLLNYHGDFSAFSDFATRTI